MRIQRRLARPLATCIFLAVAAAAFGDEPIPAERRLPRSVSAFVSLRNVPELKEQWPQTLYGQLALDESLGDFRTEAQKHIEELSRQAEQTLGLELKDLLDIPQGEVALGLMIGTDGKPSQVFLIDFGSREEAIHKLLEKLTERAKEGGYDQSEDEFEDNRLIIHRTPAEEGDETPPASIVYCLKDTFLIVGDGVAPIRDVLTRWDGQHENTLGDNPVFRHIADTCRDEQQETRPLATFFVDPLAIARAAAASSPQLKPYLPLVQAMIPQFSLDKFKGFGGTLDLARGEFDTVTRMLAYLEPPPRGVINAFQFTSAAQAPPAWVTAQADSYFSIQWDIEKAYGTVETIFDQFRGPGALARLVQQLADDEQFGNVHLRKDLIEQLTGRIQVVTLPAAEGNATELKGAEAEDVSIGKFLFGLQARNADSARALLRKVAGIQGIPLKERDFQGEAVYELEIPLLDPDAPPLGLAVAADNLMFASDVTLLEGVLRGAAEVNSLAESAAYARIARRFPEQSAAIGFTREENPLTSVLELLQSPVMAMQFPDVDSLIEKIPPMDSLRKFLPSSGFYMVPDEKGYRMVSFTLRRVAE